MVIVKCIVQQMFRYIEFQASAELYYGEIFDEGKLTQNDSQGLLKPTFQWNLAAQKQLL